MSMLNDSITEANVCAKLIYVLRRGVTSAAPPKTQKSILDFYKNVVPS